MRKGLTEIVFILDRSGSMSGLEKDTIGGFNTMLEKQKHVEGEATISTVLFDHAFEVLHNRLDIKHVNPITSKEYYVRGSTALLDAIGRGIVKINRIQQMQSEHEKAEKVIFIITTDGMENASRQFTYSDIKNLIEKQKEQFGWEFIFLGANIDAVETAARFGIHADRAANYHADSEGTVLNYEVISDAIHTFRTEKMMDANWKNDIDKDFKTRKVSK